MCVPRSVRVCTQVVLTCHLQVCVLRDANAASPPSDGSTCACRSLQLYGCPLRGSSRVTCTGTGRQPGTRRTSLVADSEQDDLVNKRYKTNGTTRATHSRVYSSGEAIVAPGVLGPATEDRVQCSQTSAEVGGLQILVEGVCPRESWPTSRSCLPRSVSRR